MPPIEDDDDDVIAEDEIDGGADEVAEEDEVEEDEAPAPKAKAKKKVKPAADEDEDEAPAPRKKTVVGVKSKGKEKTKVKTKTEKNSKNRGTSKPKPKLVRASRTGNRPFLDTSGIGRAFKLAEKGIKVSALKRFITEKLDAQPWILSFIRRGATLNGRFAWSVEEEKGVIKVGNVRLFRRHLAA